MVYWPSERSRWGSPRGGPCSLQKLACVPLFPQFFRSCSLLLQSARPPPPPPLFLDSRLCVAALKSLILTDRYAICTWSAIAHFQKEWQTGARMGSFGSAVARAKTSRLRKSTWTETESWKILKQKGKKKCQKVFVFVYQLFGTVYNLFVLAFLSVLVSCSIWTFVLYWTETLLASAKKS